MGERAGGPAGDGPDTPERPPDRPEEGGSGRRVPRSVALLLGALLVVGGALLVVGGGPVLEDLLDGARELLPGAPPTATEEPRAPSEPEPTAGAPADRILSGEQELPDGFTVPAGEVWAFDPDTTTTVTVSANVVVEGTLRMRPADASVVHTLEFTGIDETEMVGGHTEAPIPEDVGLWVVDEGQLDLVGTRREGWNRTGESPTWREDDELVVAPTTPGDFEGFEPFEAGAEVPSVTAPDGTRHHAEVANLTRNVRIHGGGSNPPEMLADDGRAHVICLLCERPQQLKWVELRWVGPRAPHERDGTDGLLGRYGLHFHVNADGSRGSVVEGVVIRDAGNHAFVPHTSHGITIRDTVSYDTYEAAYWWDPGDLTHDLLYDHALAMLVRDHPETRGYSNRGFSLEGGEGNAVVDSAAVGVVGRKVNAGGFHWPSSANNSDGVWRFEDNVAHNNQTGGLTAWQNDGQPHVVADSVAYQNQGPGISHGAYLNDYTYRNVVLFGNGAGIEQHALGASDGQRFVGIDTGGDDLVITKHRLSGDGPVVYENLRLRGGRIVVDERGGGGVLVFRSTDPRLDLGRDDFVLQSRLSTIRVVNANREGFELR